MKKNLFAAEPRTEQAEAREVREPQTRRLSAPDYTASPCGLPDHILAFILGFVAGFAVLYIFYKFIPAAVLGGAVTGIVYVFVAEQKAMDKRIRRLRVQFFDLLEAMSVAMRAGNPVLKALESAREDLSLIYSQQSDIIVELDLIISKFHNAVPLSEAFSDFARRSGLEDVASFASIYATIEGKSSRADEIVRETQQIIADKMEIEMEIDTLMTAAKSEVNIMLVMPLVILGIIGTAGAGFMDAIYTEPAGRAVATEGLVVLIISFMARKFSNVEI
ncbi:MAG: type II secretion system F family protein [Dysosmobacter sp.]